MYTLKLPNRDMQEIVLLTAWLDGYTGSGNSLARELTGLRFRTRLLINALRRAKPQKSKRPAVRRGVVR